MKIPMDFTCEMCNTALVVDERNPSAASASEFTALKGIVTMTNLGPLASRLPAPGSLEEAGALIEAERIKAQRIEPRIRRLAVALHDLGLGQILRPGWATVGGSDPCSEEPMVQFADLSGRQFDRLVGLLEGLAEGHTPAVGPRCSGQLSFDFGASAALSNVAADAGLHLGLGAAR